MEANLWKVLHMLAFFHGARSQAGYRTYNIDSFNLCSFDRSEGSIYIPPWEAAILTFGNPEDSNEAPPGRDLHRCEVSIQTHEDFGLAAVIQEMKLQGTLNKFTNAWVCQGDYVRMSSTGETFAAKFLDLFPGGLFKDEISKKLCGRRKGRPKFSNVGSTADVFSTLVSNMKVEFHQKKKATTPTNNYFKIVITTFKHVKDAEACQGKYQCYGSERYCIHPRYMCDSYYNCAFPLGGGDEMKCQDELYHPIFSTTSTIITTLSSIVGICFVLGCLYTLIKKIRSQSTSESGTPTPGPGLLPDPTAPALQRQHTLPPYEAVVMADATSDWKSGDPPPPEVGELPPNYQTLFPDGPPKNLNTDNSHTEQPSDTQLTES